MLICTKNKPHLSLLSWNITKTLQTCYFGYFGHVWSHPPQALALSCRKLWCLSATKKSAWRLNVFYRYYTLENLAIWLTTNILGNNSKTSILPDMRFAMESQQLKELSFRVVFKRKKWQNFQKNVKDPILWALFAQIWAKMNFSQKSGNVTF